MDGLQSILLRVWQEACRHIEINASTAKIAELLAREMPIGSVLVCRIDRERNDLETVAVGTAGPEGPSSGGRTDLSPAHMRRLLAWCGQGKVLHLGERDPLPKALWNALPPQTGADRLVGPLGTADSPAGLLVLSASPGSRFTDRHAETMKALLDPFSAALENDWRLRETTALRAAAEADKSSLLARLGRKDLADTIVGAQTGLRSVMERVELVARSDAPILLIGDTGTGKEVIARAVHNRSARAGGPFLRVNCGAIPPELIDSSLFGHERGAFTGAVAQHRGWFERADSGTLFLDEIGDLPLAAQVRLLRVLQDGWLNRVGSQEPVHVDVRIVAATHRDLQSMVAARTFREDLWYRIAVFPIILPRLSERPGDIPAMARHFAARAATRFGLAEAMPTDEDIVLLRAYSWPGNVREMASVIDRAAILGNGGRLEIAKALGVSGVGAQAPSAAVAVAIAAGPGPQPREFPSLNAVMKQHIEAGLRATHGRVEGPHGVARLLAINPHTLRARMRKLGIDVKSFR